jgi:hypothetical protein
MRRAFNMSLHLPSHVPCFNIDSESAPGCLLALRNSTIAEQIDLYGPSLPREKDDGIVKDHTACVHDSPAPCRTRC